MDNELYHWKYVKREKVGGKWVYTYDNPTAQARQQAWTTAEKNATAKAAKEATKYNGGVAIGAGGVKKIKSTFTDTDKLLSRKTTIDTSDTRTEEYQRGKIERNIDTAKEYVKERLGFNAKEKYDNASRKYVSTAVDASMAGDRVESNKRDIHDPNSNKREKSRANNELDRNVDNYVDKNKKYLKSEVDRKKAKEAYYDTPIGKLAEAKERIESGENYIDVLFGKKRKK